MADLSKLQIEGIVNTLPIGFYVGRNIPTQLVDDECSWYNTKEDCIGISTEQIKKGTDKVPENEVETMVRSNFYHEVSHAFLTPQGMPATDVVNIFEDERIEKLLKDYYYSVDFEKSVQLINDTEHTPENALQAFFSLVRFHKGKPEHLAKVAEIIEKYRDLHRNSNLSKTKKYVEEIEELFKEVCKEYEENPEQYLAETLKGSGEGESEGEPKGCAVGGKCAKGLTRGEVFGICDKILKAEQPLDTKLYDTLSRLFENFKRKNSGGSCLQAHSGILNPRLADRPDYRLFERASPTRGNNSFGNFHLNLFIDISGSFRSNQDTTNSILQVLEQLEKTNPLFSFDVITINYKVTLLDRSKRRIECFGGNHLDKDIFDMFRKQQYPMTYNYNIIMFDGDAYSNDASRTAKWLPNGEGFQAFAQNNCTIVSDYDNESYIKKYCPTTRTIYTKNYNAKLVENIITVLYQALS